MLQSKVKIALFTLLTVYASMQTAQAHDEPISYDRINLSASASNEIENDTLIAVLYFEKQGNNPALLADAVNKIIHQAVSKAKSIPEIKVQTLNYQSYPVYFKQKLSAWRVRQSIRLESMDKTQISHLIGELQQQLAVQSINYSVSTKKQTEIEDKLTIDAIKSFNQRAQLITQQLGRSSYRLINMNISTTGSKPVFAQTRHLMMSKDKVATPSLETGTQTLKLNVNGSIELEN